MSMPFHDLVEMHVASVIENEVPDIPMDLSFPKSRLPDTAGTPRPIDLVNVFSQSLVRATAVQRDSSNAPTSTRRLKQHTMGEVLTSPEVQERLRLVEEG